MSDTEEVIDLHSMKVTELKQELKSRGLPVSGAKAELIERLENYMQEHEGVEVVEEEETEDSVENVDEKASDEKVEEPVSNDISVNANESQNNAEAAGSPEPQNDISLAEEDDKDAVKVSVNIQNVSEKDRKLARANRFAGGNISGNTTDELKKKQTRAERFGMPAAAASSNISKSDTKEALKRRAERFGTGNSSSSSPLDSSEQAKKLKSRADRFGTGAIGGGLGTAGSDDKKAARAARFAMAK